MMRCSRFFFIIFLLLMTLESGCRSDESVPRAGDPEPGVALQLATERAQRITGLTYDLSFSVPAELAEPVTGKASIRFTIKDTAQPIVLDFTPGADYLSSVSIGGKPANYRVTKDHIVIPSSDLVAGENVVDIQFRAGDAALNRNPDFMYTLFVPARARLTFPCFDQPDLKARFALELIVPAGWQAVSNGAETFHEESGQRLRIRYSETQPIPTYLFAFAAGKFEIETAERNGRWYRMFHRETDAKKVARNRDAIFDLHASSLDWLEKYTAIPYRFGKFDLVAIPSFQFGGMEHPGAIFYNAGPLLLDESATENQILGRASTIAHETAHMWFGDLVTMQWFNDVWMKEVFANFMAAKIVNPAFPKVNHELRFLVAHYPAAYAVDRTAGTHPIRQELANLDEAGSLYGPIIYQKAPIVMRQLERILGPDRLQQGLQVYLKQFQFGNATWLDLVKVLDELTETDLFAWSRAWVEEPGRPIITTDFNDARIAFSQSDPQQGRSLRWAQQMEVLVGNAQTVHRVPLDLQNEHAELKPVAGMARPDFVLPTGGGLAYGDFALDDASRRYLLQHLPDIKDPLTRGAAWITLWEEMLGKRVRPMDFIELALRSLPRENTEQNVQLVLGYVEGAFWGFIPDSTRQELAGNLERILRDGIHRSASSSMKSTYFTAFRSMVTTPEGVAFLERVWSRQEKVPGLTLAETDEATMALELAVRSVPTAPAILETQRGRFMNPDRKARFEFVMPALSEDASKRAAWFESLKDVNNRRREPWVLEGLAYLNHPLRAAQSEKHIRPALDLLAEIQRTGDIFFPKRWMDAVLGGYKTRSAADTVRAFLSEYPDYPIRLRRIILQSADELFRAAEIL
jgi:aminopeptidase N